MLDEIPYVIKEWMKKEGILEQFINGRAFNPYMLYGYINASLDWDSGTPEGFAIWRDANERLNSYLASVFTYEVMNNLHFKPVTEYMRNVKVEVLSIGYENGIGITIHTSGSVASIIIPICRDKYTSIAEVFLGRGEHTGKRASVLNYSLNGEKVKIHPVYDKVFSQKSLKTLLGITDEA